MAAPSAIKPAAAEAEDAGVRTRLAGAACIAASALCISSHSCVVRVVSDAGFSTTAVTFWVGATRLALATLLVPWRREWRNNVFCNGHDWRFVLLVVFRQLVGCGALALVYAAYAIMPLGEATSIVYTAPVFTTIMAYFALREPITPTNVCAAAAACGGVLLIARAGGGAAEPAASAGPRALGTCLAVAGSVTLAASMVATRAIGFRQPPVVSSGWYGLSLLLTSVPMMAVGGAELAPAAVAPRHWALMIGGASVSFLGQTLLIMGLQRLEAGPVNVLATLEVAFSFVWQTTLLHTPSHPAAALGAAIIVVSAIGVSLRQLLAGGLRACGGRGRARPVAHEAGGTPAAPSSGAGAGAVLGRGAAAAEHCVAAAADADAAAAETMRTALLGAEARA